MDCWTFAVERLGRIFEQGPGAEHFLFEAGGGVHLVGLWGWLGGDHFGIMLLNVLDVGCLCWVDIFTQWVGEGTLIDIETEAIMTRILKLLLLPGINLGDLAKDNIKPVCW